MTDSTNVSKIGLCAPSEDISEAKKRLRKEGKCIRDALYPEERKRGEILITERLLGHQ